MSVKADEGLAYGPQILDRGKAVLFTFEPPGPAGSLGWDHAQIVVQPLPSGQRKVVVPTGTDGRYLPTGHIVYAQGENIFALPFDVKTLEAKAGPVAILQGVARASGPLAAAANLSVSLNGTLAYIPGRSQTTSVRTLALVDRTGKTQTLPLPAGPYRSPRVSPDGKELAFQTEDKNQIWLFDLSGGAAPRPLTFEGRNFAPVWTHHGRSLIFQSDRDGGSITLYRQAADGTSPAEQLTKPERGSTPIPFSVDPSDNILAFARSNAGLVRAVEFLSLRQNQTIEPIRESSATAAFSPNGVWVSYTYRLGERPQIFVRPFPSLSTKYQIAEEGNFPLWSPDGKQLFYTTAPNNFFAVDIRTEPSFASGKPSKLPIPGIVYDSSGPRNFDITPDGRFVVVIPASQIENNPQRTSQINLVFNWSEELKQRVPMR